VNLSWFATYAAFLNLTMAAISNAESLQKITAALSVFSTSTDKQQIANANEWLQDFQHTVSKSFM
jgi:hypothetical protein